jgi:chromosome segregation ATPase
MLHYLVKLMIVVLGLSTDNTLASAQESMPEISTFNSKTRNNYKDTQNLIKRTQTKLDLVRTQNNARAREIEALTNKVSVIINRMSGQGEDNTALQSEISVLDEMLTIERKANGDLKSKNIQLLDKLDAIKIQNTSIKNKSVETISKYEANLIETKKHLKLAIVEITNREELNKQLEIDIKTLATEVVRLRKQVKLLKKNRYRSKLGAN